MNFNTVLHLIIRSARQNVNFTKIYYKSVKFRSFWKMLITLKKTNIFKRFWSRFKGKSLS